MDERGAALGKRRAHCGIRDIQKDQAMCLAGIGTRYGEVLDTGYTLRIGKGGFVA